MSKTPPSEGKLLYHITHLSNMPSIMERGLLPRKALQNNGVRFTDIADPDIISKREKYKEALSNYVLFHFYAKNPFDGAVCKKYGSENMAIITIRRDLYKKHRFFIIPSHPLDNDTPEIYPYEEGLSHVRWDILDMKDGRDYHNSEIRKACMAECVMEYKIPINAFFCIYVSNENAKHLIESIPNGESVNIKVAPAMFP